MGPVEGEQENIVALTPPQRWEVLESIVNCPQVQKAVPGNIEMEPQVLTEELEGCSSV
jgi:hypothetical protein